MKDLRCRSTIYSHPSKLSSYLIKLLGLVLIILGPGQLDAQLSTHFVTTWKTDNTGTSDPSSITVPT